MRLPFVSRERFDEERARNKKLEDELSELRKLLIPGLRAEPEAPMPKLGVDTDLSKIQPIKGKVTLAMVTADANRAAQKRAVTPGAKPISEEVAENDMKHWRQASGD